MELIQPPVKVPPADLVAEFDTGLTVGEQAAQGVAALDEEGVGLGGKVAVGVLWCVRKSG